MTRGMDAANLSSASADSVSPVLFVEFQFDGETEYAHTRLGTITWGGHDWTGIGTIIEISSVEENSDLSRRTVTYKLSGVSGENISIVLNEQIQGRTAKLYLGFFNEESGQLVATPELLDQGRMDVPDIEIGKSCSVSITAESRMAVWSRPVIRRYTDADQKARFPGDRFFDLMTQGKEKSLFWGQKDPTKR